jgi:hypothetical protein
MTVHAKLVPFAVMCGMAGTLAAQESEAPDLSLLEFLGSWEEGDDVWIIVDGLLDEGYEVEVDETAVDSEDADVNEPDEAAFAEVGNEADAADETTDSGESNDVEGTDKVAAIDAD